EEEAGGMVKCTGACLQLWEPLTIQGGQPTGTVSGGTLGVLQRSDGKTQGTIHGAPGYRLAHDQPRTPNPHGRTAAFRGQQFTWHAATGGNAPSTPPSSSGSSGRTPGY